MLYEFLHPAGHVVEAAYPVKDAPAIGSYVKINGEFCMRIASLPSGYLGHRDMPPHFKGAKIPNLAPSLAQNPSPYKMREKNGVRFREHADGTRSDEHGSRVVESASEMKRLCAEQGQIWQQS